MTRLDAGGSPPIISTFGLTKRYKLLTALRELTLDVREGEVLGLLGPNGSGKTTAIRLLLGLIKPTAGRALIAGHDCWRDSLAVRRLVTYIPGELRLPGNLRGYQLLKFYSNLRGGDGLDRAVAIAERIMRLDLSRKVRALSTGMKQKLALALAFADPADILILDEPTSALDPSARGDVLTLVSEAHRSGQTVIFSGHVLSEVEQVADRVAILRQGRLVHVEDMHARRNLRMLLVRYDGTPPEAYPDELELSVREVNGDVYLLEHRGDGPGVLLQWLASQRVADIAIGTEDLRSLYDRFHGPNVRDVVEESP